MAKQNLVIVESPAKAKTIGKYLGADFEVKACMGHLRDLPKSVIGVDLENDFEPVYKPIKGKEDIMNALIDSAEEHYEASFGSSEHIGKLPESKEEFIQSTLGRISFTLHDPMIRKIRKFLVQEQFRSKRLAAITTRHQLDGLQGMYTKIISGMMEKGLFREDDPTLLATEVTAPVVLLISKADRQPQYEQEIMESIEKHIRHFCDVYMEE